MRRRPSRVGFLLLPFALVFPLVGIGCGTTQEEPRPAVATRAAEPQTAELDWREAYPDSGAQLRFHVDRLEIRNDGWSAVVAIENTTAIGWELGSRPVELRFGLMLFPTNSVEELEGDSRSGNLPSLRRALSIEPAPPDTLAPGETWRATLAAPGSLADGSYVRVSFGTLVARGTPPPGMESTVIWITDKAQRL